MNRYTAIAAAAACLCAAAAAAQSVAVRNLLPAGAFEVANSGPETSLETKMRVQRWTNGAWSDEASDLQLVRACNPPAPAACITIKAGETLRPPHWNGLSCGSQCAAACRGNMMLPPGTFRFVVSACTGGSEVVGQAFDMAQTR